MREILSVALFTAIMSTSAAAAPKKALVKGAATATSPQAYAASVAGVDCSNVVQRHSTVKPLLPMLKAWTKEKTVQLEKGEFETTAQFQVKQGAHYRNLFGGTDRIVVVLRLKDYNLRYDADKGVMIVGGAYTEDLYHHGRDYSNREHTIELFRDAVSSETYDASNAYGATVEVERTNKTRAALLFPKGQLPPMPALEMTPDQARSFKSNPLMLIVATLKRPYFNFAYDRIKASIDYPYETRLSSYGFSVDMACAVFTSGSDELYRLRAN